MNKKKYLWFLLLLIPLTVFIVFMSLFLTNTLSSHWLDLSLGTSSAAATIILGVMVYVQAEKNKESDKELKDQDLLIRTTPYISFEGIEFASREDNAIWAGDDDLPDCMKFDSKNSNLPENYYVDKGNGIEQYILFRFIFNCDYTRGLNGLIFKSINVYPNYDEQYRTRAYCEYSFSNKTTKQTSNISYIGDNRYQVCKYFVFPSEFLRSSLAVTFTNDITDINKGETFYNIEYEAYSIHKTKISGVLKFRARASMRDNEIVFDKISRVSNWIDEPTIIRQ